MFNHHTTGVVKVLKVRRGARQHKASIARQRKDELTVETEVLMTYIAVVKDVPTIEVSLQAIENRNTWRRMQYHDPVVALRVNDTQGELTKSFS